jgi:tetrahydromethanopterin S-methyltransferase subunit G
VDFAQGLHPVASRLVERDAAVAYRIAHNEAGHPMARSAGKLIGLIIGCVIVAVMLFMAVAILSGVFSGEQ